MKSFRFSIFPSMLKIQKKQTTFSKAFTTIVLYFINYRKSKMISSRLLIPIYLLFYLVKFQVQNIRNVCCCIEMLLIGPWCWILAGECHLFFQELNLRKLLFIRSDKKKHLYSNIKRTYVSFLLWGFMQRYQCHWQCLILISPKYFME